MRRPAPVVVLAEIAITATAVFAYLPRLRPWGLDLAPFVLIVTIGAFALGMGWLIARERPELALGPLVGAGGAVFVALVPPPGPGALDGSWMLMYVPFAVTLILVPDGRPADRRRRLLAVGIVAIAFGFQALALAGTLLPESGSRRLEPVGMGIVVAFFGALVASALAPLQRYRRGDHLLRLRLRWMLLAAAVVPGTLLLCWVSYLLLGDPRLVVGGLVLSVVVIPAATAVAVLRPDWFDVDRALVGTAAGGLLSAAALALLTVVAALGGSTLERRPTPVAVAAAAALTLAAVVAYPLVRRRLERLLFPGRGRALLALRELARGIDRGVREPEEVEGVLRASLQDEGLRVVPARADDHSGEPTPTIDGVPLLMRGTEVGRLVLSAGHRRPPGAVCAAAAPIVEAVRMRAELQRALADLEASRARIVQVEETERRRLERDLHDGSQQRLVALGMRLRLLQHTVPMGSALMGALDEAVAELALAVDELRQIAHGLRPSALADGLPEALRRLCGRLDPGIDVVLDVGDVPDQVVASAYYVVGEAVTNALRHASATTVQVRVHALDGFVRIVVSDDGLGGARIVPHAGLAGIDDRVAALGGELSIASPARAGTRVEATLPCAS